LDLDRRKQFRDALNLVNDHSSWVIDEPDGIGDRRLPDQGQVQIAPLCRVAAGELTQQRAFPALAGSVDQDDPGVLQGFSDHPLGMSGDYTSDRRTNHVSLSYIASSVT
jgi:hypothetical protein